MLLVLGAAVVAIVGCRGRTTTSRLGPSWVALWMRARPLVLPHHSPTADKPPPATSTSSSASSVHVRVKDLLQQFEEEQGSFYEFVTHMNSAVKDLFIRVLFVETSGTLVQDLDSFSFDFGRFECSTLKICSNL